MSLVPRRRYYAPTVRAGGAGVAGYYASQYGPAAWRAAKATANYAYQRSKNYFARQKGRRAAYSRIPKSYSKKYSKYAKKRQPKSIKKRVVRLERAVADDISTVTKRNRSTDALLCAVNSVNHAGYDSWSKSVVESAVSDLKFFNPAAPATLIAADISQGTYPSKIRLSCFAGVKCVNNYQVPCEIRIYSCNVKADTTIGAVTAMSNGYADNPDGALSLTQSMVFPGDSKQLSDLYNVKMVKKCELQPGQFCNATWSSGDVTFDPATLDNHTSTYQRKLKSQSFIVRIEGVLGHDSIADQQTTLAAGVDVQRYQTYTVKYDSGGKKITDVIRVDSNNATFSNTGVVSSRPVADNIGYSLG